MLNLNLSSNMDRTLMVFIILDCLHLMNLKKVTMHQKLKLTALSISPLHFQNEGDDDD